jgi:hypothetical protein
VERQNRRRVLSSDFGHRHKGVSRSPHPPDASTVHIIRSA